MANSNIINDEIGSGFIIDKKKGLKNAIASLMPNVEYKHCIRQFQECGTQ